MPNANLHDFLERYVATLNTHEFRRLTEFMHDDLTVNGQPMTRDQVIAGLEGHIDAVPDLVWRVTASAIEGERMAACFLNKGTPAKTWFGSKPTGSPVEYSEHLLHKVRDGRFYELNFLLDIEAVRSQLGV